MQRPRLRLPFAAAWLVLGGCSWLESGTAPYPGVERSVATPVVQCPEDGYGSVATDSPVFVRFAAPMDPRTLNSEQIILASGREGWRGSLRYDPQTFTVWYTPHEALRPATQYDIYLFDGLRDAYGGKPFAEPQVLSFVTASATEVDPLRCPLDSSAPLPRRPDWCGELEGRCPDDGDAELDPEDGSN